MKKLIILITLLISTSAFAGEKSCAENTREWIEDDQMIWNAIVSVDGKMTILINNDPYHQGKPSVNHLILGWNPELVKSLEAQGCKDITFIPKFNPTRELGQMVYREQYFGPFIRSDWKQLGAMWCNKASLGGAKCSIQDKDPNKFFRSTKRTK